MLARECRPLPAAESVFEARQIPRTFPTELLQKVGLRMPEESGLLMLMAEGTARTVRLLEQ